MKRSGGVTRKHVETTKNKNKRAKVNEPDLRYKWESSPKSWLELLRNPGPPTSSEENELSLVDVCVKSGARKLSCIRSVTTHIDGIANAGRLLML